MTARTLLLIASALLAVFTASCDSGTPDEKSRTTEESATPNKGEPSTTPVSEPGASIPLEPIGLVDDILHREPEKGEWQGEAFNDLASAQLKKLGKILEKEGESLSASKLESIAAESIRSDALAPQNAQAVLENPELMIKRAGESELAARNRAEFADVLKALPNGPACARNLRSTAFILMRPRNRREVLSAPRSPARPPRAS